MRWWGEGSVPRTLVPRRRCPECGGVIPETRFGVRLTPLWAVLVDRLRIAGDEGVEGYELRSFLEEQTGNKNVTRTLPATVGLINEHLEDSGFRIRCYRVGNNRGGNKQWHYYYLVKT
jgi:hypothetical protein